MAGLVTKYPNDNCSECSGFLTVRFVRMVLDDTIRPIPLVLGLYVYFDRSVRIANYEGVPS